MADFKIEVPIEVKGTGGKGIGEKIADAFSKQIKGLTKSIGVGAPGAEGMGIGGKSGLKMAGTLAAIFGVLDAMSFIIKPIMNLFKVILMLFFLPLIPIFKPAMQALAAFIKWFAPVMQKAAKWTEKIYYKVVDFIVSLIQGISGVLGFVFGKLGDAWEFIKNFGTIIWRDYIVPGFEAVLGFGTKIWDEIVQPAWMFLSDVGSWIWEDILKPAWNYLEKVGEWVWDIIKSPWKWLAEKIKTIWDWIKDALGSIVPSWLGGGRKDDFISRPGQAPVSFNPSDTIIGVKDISKLGGSIVININNPIVRQSSDIKNIANEVSRVLQRQMSGRISSG